MDNLLQSADAALRTLFARPHASRACPSAETDDAALDPGQRRHAAGLMRVNHVGEVCAQALYSAQALATRNPKLRAQFTRACTEETDHLAWTEQRLVQLGERPSLLNPLWYAGAFGLGLVAGKLGDAVSLGFVVETERQVGEHLQSHLNELPAEDHASRAIVAHMHADELQHAQEAQDAGATELPQAVKSLMRLAAKVMTTTAYRL